MTCHPFVSKSMDYLYVDAPSTADRILQISNWDGILKALELLKWSAVALAFVAAFGSLVLKFRVLGLNAKRLKPLDSHEEDCSDSEDGVFSSISSPQESHKAYPLRDHFQKLVGGGEGEDFSVAGVSRMLRLRRCNPPLRLSSWSPSSVVDDGGVVKLWEGWGLDLRGGGDEWRSRGRGKPSVWFAENEDYSRLVMGVWDRRMRPDVAAIAQEWRPSSEEKALRSTRCTHSLFADIDIWWWVDPTKAVVARLMDCRGGDGGAVFHG